MLIWLSYLIRKETGELNRIGLTDVLAGFSDSLTCPEQMPPFKSLEYGVYIR